MMTYHSRKEFNMAEFYKKRKKICQMCTGKSVDYKDPMILNKYLNEKGKILPRRMTGACAKHQRHIAREIKRARFLAIIPYVK
jgi:small subunit ribosomal protein S18